MLIEEWSRVVRQWFNARRLLEALHASSIRGDRVDDKFKQLAGRRLLAEWYSRYFAEGAGLC